MRFHARKFLGTLRILFFLGMARTFGRYVVSEWSCEHGDCARYVWRGQTWLIPTAPLDDVDAQP